MTQKSPKVSIIGAGAVGSTLAMRVAEGGLADVVLLDVIKNLARGHALDISDASPVIGHAARITGTENYEDIRSSDIVAITAGLARRPGMTREELTFRNAAIVKDISEKIQVHAPSSRIIVVTNPLDAMTYLAYKTAGFKRERVLGMAGVLDGARFAGLLAEELGVAPAAITTHMLGSHGDTMVPLLSQTRVDGKPLGKALAKEVIEKIVKRTQGRGAEIVGLLGMGSAYYSPSAAVYKMLKAILSDSKETMDVCAYLDGEYGLKDICIGVPCTLGAGGIEEVVELAMTKDEADAFADSAKAIRGVLETL